MNTPLSPEKSGIRPFENDVEYLMAELEWVRVRTRRIQAQNERQGSRTNPARASIAARHLIPAMVCGEQVACLLKEEHDIRSLIDSRLKVGGDQGKIPSLIRLCRDHGLGDFEKHILLLGIVACLGTTAAEKHLFGLESVYASSQLYPEIVFEFLEMGYEERIHVLPKLLAEGVLRREGFILMCYDPATPATAVGAGIELTGKAVALMTGIPGFEGFSESKL